MTTAATASPASILEQFKWEPQPEAERLVHRLATTFLQTNRWAASFANRLHGEAGTRFVDLIDHIHPGRDHVDAEALQKAGYAPVEGEPDVFAQPHGIFPRIALYDAPGHSPRVALRVECVADFLATHGLDSEITGLPGDPIRLALMEEGLAVIERHGIQLIHGRCDSTPDDVSRLATSHAEAFRLRRRSFELDEEGFELVWEAIEEAIPDLGVDYTCDLFFAAEREYWQRRNHAAQVQKARQDRLGIGWANHDHHTYRCSRRHFARLVGIWEKLGFVCRERFYAGKEAGWGAQVMEQPNAGIVTFNDVDLSPDELLIDFAHDPLPERKELGTVGLWCALHGESFLEAGMHHLECMFDFNALKEQLERDHGVGVMKPFTDFPYLKQAFTVGERWPVREERIAALLEKGQITPEQAEKFRKEGAIGSHLENLERNQGFKGFNQTGVSEIIAATDPRKQVHA